MVTGSDMSWQRLAVIAASCFLTLSCAADAIPGPPSGFGYAAASNWCGPTDGPATAIYLSPSHVDSLEPPAPYVRIAIWHPLDSVAGRTWSIDGSAAASYFTVPNEFEIATTGHVTINSISSDTTVMGSADLTFLTGGRITGGFRASWLARALLCG